VTVYIASFNLLIAFLELLLANILIFQNPTGKKNRLAAARCLTVGLFALFSVFFYNSEAFQGAFLWNQVRSFPYILLPALTLHISLLFAFDSLHRFRKYGIIIGYGSALIFLLANLIQNVTGYPIQNATGNWITVATAQSALPFIVSAWAVTLVAFSSLLGIVLLFGQPHQKDTPKNWPAFLGLTLPIAAVILFSILPTSVLPEFLAYFSGWVFISDLLICIGILGFHALNLGPLEPVLNTLQEGLIWVGSKGNIRFANLAFQQIFNFQKQNLIETNFAEILRTPDQVLDLNFLKKQVGMGPVSLRLQTSEQKERFAEITVLQTRNVPGRGPDLIILIQDLTQEHKHTELIANQFDIQLGDRDRQIIKLTQAKQALEQKLATREKEEKDWRHSLHELQSVAALSSSLRTARDVNEMLSILLREVTASLSADSGAILILKGNALVFTSLYGLPDELKDYQHRFSPDLLWEVIETNQPVYFSANGGNSNQKPMPAFIRSAGTICALPLKTSEKQIGLLLILFNGRRGHGELDLGILTTVSEIASNALYRASIQDTLEQRVNTRTRNLQVLSKIAAIPNQAKSQEEILEFSLDLLLNSLHGKAAVVYLCGNANSLQVRTHPVGSHPELQSDLRNISFENSIWRTIYQSNQPMLVPSIENDIRLDFYVVTDLRTLGECSLIGSPIYGPNETFGTICLFSNSGEIYSREDLTLLTAVADQLGIMIENVRLRLMEEQNAISDERRRLGRDLHDSISRLLESQMRLANQAVQEIADCHQANLPDHLDELKSMAIQSHREMRLLIYELGPSALDKFGLFKALEYRLDTVERRAGLLASLNGDYSFRLPGVMEKDFFRIARAVLDHSLKDIHTTQISIVLKSDYDRVNMEFFCDGDNLDEGNPANTAHFRSLRQQVDRLGGKLVQDMDPNNKFRVVITIKGQ
jgi:signal transduction histidine kinase